VFRVTAAVLRAAQGQVRCGVCDAHFDAIQFLSDTVEGELAHPPPAVALTMPATTVPRPAPLPPEAAPPQTPAAGPVEIAAPIEHMPRPTPPAGPPPQCWSEIAASTTPSVDEDRTLAEIAAALARDAQASHSPREEDAGVADDTNVLEPADVEDIELDGEPAEGEEIPDSALEFNLPPGEWDRVFVVDTASSAITPLDIDFEMLANAAEGAVPATVLEAAFAGAFEPHADVPAERATDIPLPSPADVAAERAADVAPLTPADVAAERAADVALLAPADAAPEAALHAAPEVLADVPIEPPAAVASDSATPPIDEDSLARTDEFPALVLEWPEAPLLAAPGGPIAAGGEGVGATAYDRGPVGDTAFDPALIPTLVPALLSAPTPGPAPAVAAADVPPQEPARDEAYALADQTLAELIGKASTRAARAAPRRGAGAFAAGSALLALTLGAQLVHQFRESLADTALLGPPLAALYARLGNPIEPRWDLSAYDIRQWGAGAGNAPGALRLRASVINRAARGQPYPLLRVTLEDRFGGKVARREFTPAEYLPGRIAPRQLLAPGARADADLSFADPGSQAVGFELDVCLPRGGRLACGSEQKPPEGG